ncbi:hypothetical protein BAE44_0005214 [Dichanthelium oligosanthes]|uniref:Uncharacterized protein n=1 Tax=Dichanthelium oligosanthes TaxID=888268 RepID=A0A1E5W948_9POAL|nr:hypothetical protein BAE44_0005214 [Dichanthelium oligosanthes]
MEPVFAVAQEPAMPPQQRRQLGHTTQVQGGGGWRRPVRCALALVFFLAVTGNFAFAAYRARHSPRDLAFVLVAYFLLALLVCCVARLEQLRRDPAAAARVGERRCFRIAVWVVSVALANTFASRVTDALPGLALKLVVWGVTAVVLGLGYYSLFFSKDDAERCCGAELGRGQADDGRRPATALHELSPEEKMAMDDGCKQAAAPTSPPRMKNSRRLRVMLPHAACLVLAAAHLARAVREREPRDVAFVVAAHAALALLFLCVGRHEEAATTSEARGRLRLWVWALSTALTGLFASRVAPAMPPPLGLLIYGMAVLVTAGGFALQVLCDAGDGAASVGTRT